MPSLIELSAAIGRTLDLEADGAFFRSWRVAWIAYRLTERLAPYDAPVVLLAGFLSDSGTLSLPRPIVYELLRTPDLRAQKADVGLFFHPTIGANFLSGIAGLGEAARLVAQHHEQINGEGYPNGLAGDAIEIGAQAIWLGDHVDLLWRTAPPTSARDLLEKLQSFSAAVSPTLLAAFAESLDEALSPLVLADQALLEKAVKAELGTWRDLQFLPSEEEWDRLFDVLGEWVASRNSLYLRDYSQHVRRLALAVGNAIGLAPEAMRHLRRAIGVQNLGEIRYRGGLDLQAGRVDERQRRLIREHPEVAAGLLESVAGLEPLAMIVRHHHENWDGSGYPAGLAGEAIPLLSRLIRLCDAATAMSGARPYQKRRDLQRVMRELRRQAGKQFDPHLVPVLLKILAP